MEAILKQTITRLVPAYKWSGKEEDIQDLIKWMRMHSPSVSYDNKKSCLNLVYSYYDVEWECNSEHRIIVSEGDWIVIKGGRVFQVIKNLETEGYSIVDK